LLLSEAGSQIGREAEEMNENQYFVDHGGEKGA
jgi:hypothetical protein